MTSCTASCTASASQPWANSFPFRFRWGDQGAQDVESSQRDAGGAGVGGVCCEGGNLYPAVALALGFTFTTCSGDKEHDDENDDDDGAWDDEGWAAGEADNTSALLPEVLLQRSDSGVEARAEVWLDRFARGIDSHVRLGNRAGPLRAKQARRAASSLKHRRARRACTALALKKSVKKKANAVDVKMARKDKAFFLSAGSLDPTDHHIHHHHHHHHGDGDGGGGDFPAYDASAFGGGGGGGGGGSPMSLEALLASLQHREITPEGKSSMYWGVGSGAVGSGMRVF